MRLSHTTILACALLALGLNQTGFATPPTPVWPDSVPAYRKTFLNYALKTLNDHPNIPYKTAGADPSGLDCSGTILYLLQHFNLEAPHSAQLQYQWLKDHQLLTIVPESAHTMDDPAFAKLSPGDLIFWAHTPVDIDQPKVSHVHIYLGKEADGHPIMIGSSDGRSYRGSVVHGFGITDFKIPQANATTRIIGYGFLPQPKTPVGQNTQPKAPEEKSEKSTDPTAASDKTPPKITPSPSRHSK